MDDRSSELNGLSRRDAMKLGLASAGFSLLPGAEASAAPLSDSDGRDEGALYEGRNLPGGGQVDPRLSMTPFVEDPDYIEVAQRVSPFNLDSLYAENHRMAEKNEQLAEEFLKDGYKVSAGTFYLRAARFYQRAVGLMPEADDRMLPTFQNLLDTYEKAWKLVPSQYERVQIPYEGQTIPGYMQKPRGANNPAKLPTVIAYGGADSTVTPTWGPEYLQRGMAYLFVDGPGQGIPLRIKEIYAPPDAERVAKAIIDYLVSRPDVDPNRIGITGASMGGYTAPRMASGEKRIKAVAVWAGAYSLREDIFDYFPPIQDRLRWLCGAKDIADARKKMGEFTLESRASQIECPMFIGYSNDDRIMDPRGAFRLNKAAVKSQRIMVEGTGHDSGRIFPYRRTKADKEVLMADWMAKQLEFGVSAMNRLCRNSAFLCAAMLAANFPAQAQNPTPATVSSADTNKPFNPHDLSGVWDYYNNIPGQGIYVTPSKDMPPLTPWGKTRFDANKPGYGPRRQPGGNDPMLECNPIGVPKILFMVLPHEIVQTPDRMFMFFEREHAWRQIWTDGRGHPKDVEPTYMGDSIGWWDGDTFIVDTVGFNDKTWLDFYGSPHSDQMHLIERYRRLDRTTLLMHLVIDDPKTYTQTWVSDDKIYKLLPPKYENMEELFCVPSEEDAFTRRIRMPAVPNQQNKK